MISQRSVGRLQRLLRRLHYAPAYTVALLSWDEYGQQLYEADVDRNVLEYIRRRFSPNQANYAPAMLDGSLSREVYDPHSVARLGASDILEGQKLLKTFIEVAARRGQSLPDHCEEARALTQGLLASLQIDGYELVAGSLVPAAFKGMDIQREDDYLIGLLRKLQPANLETIVHHHDEAEKAFANGVWGSASTETRNFFVAILRGMRERATASGKATSFTSGNDSDLIKNFETIGLLSEDEKDAVLKIWVLLSYSGPHVGIQEQDRAKLTRLLVLGMTQWLCLKFKDWLNHP